MKSQLKNRFLEFVLQKNLFQPGEKVLVAVSAGVDSQVLLHLFRQCQRRLKVELGLVHLHHEWRTASADADQELVRSLAEKFRLPFFSLRQSVVRYAREQKISVEEAGHLLREKLFEELAAREGYQKIATAHHLDDQAETVLMRLLLGTGLSGLAGIRVHKGKWVRPLLFATRAEIMEYAQQQKIQFREDETNLDTTILRNKIRHQLLPLLKEQYNPRLASQLAHLATIFEEWNNFLQEQLPGMVKKFVKPISQNKFKVGIHFFRQYFSWVKVLLIEYIFQRLGQKKLRVNYQQFHNFNQWVEKSTPGSRFEWHPQLISVKRSTSVDFMILSEKEDSGEELEIDWGNKYVIPNSDLQLIISPASREEVKYSSLKTEEFIAGDHLEFPLRLRNWRAGDRFFPLGMKQSKLISDYLTDHKIGYPEKKNVKVLLSGDEIVALIGVQIDHRFRIQENTKKIYRLKLVKNE